MTTRLARRYLLLTAGMTLLLGACSGASKPAPTTAPNAAATVPAQNPTPGSSTAVPATNPSSSGGTTTGGSVDPCSLLTQAEVDAAVGQPLGPGKQDATTDCLWSTSDFAAGVTLGLRTLSDIKFATTAANSQTPATSVPGVGEQAWARTDIEGISYLWVIKGSAGFMLEVNGSHVGSLPDHGLPAEEVLAAAILGRL